jgi:hypothetical protein
MLLVARLYRLTKRVKFKLAEINVPRFYSGRRGGMLIASLLPSRSLFSHETPLEVVPAGVRF